MIFPQVAETDLHQGGRWNSIEKNSPANCQGVPQESKGAVGEPEKIQDNYYFDKQIWDRFSVGQFARLNFALD